MMCRPIGADFVRGEVFKLRNPIRILPWGWKTLDHAHVLESGTALTQAEAFAAALEHVNQWSRDR